MRFTTFLMCVFCLLLSRCVFASEADPVPLNFNGAVEIPVVQAGKLLLIEAEVEGVKGNFIFDTGAPYLVLNATYFRNIVPIDTIKAGGVAGGSCDVCRCKVEEMSLQGINFKDLDADIANLGPLENKKGVQIFGLLGLNLFKSFQVDIDLPNQRIHFMRTMNSVQEIPLCG